MKNLKIKNSFYLIVLMTLLSFRALAVQDHESFVLPDNQNGRDISFVSCPIVQDTSSVPCWFSQNEGTRYFLGIQQAISAEFHPPQLGHSVLVEGKILEGFELCGAPVLHPIKISVLPEIDKSCDVILPAIPGIEPPPHDRGPGPSNHGLEPRERRAPEPSLRKPYMAREYVIPFSFDSAIMPGSVTQILSDAIAYARAIEASEIEIQSFSASSLLSNGQELIETSFIASRRSENLKIIFLEAGFEADKLQVFAQQETLKGDGVQDYLLRKAIVTVRP